MCDRCDEERQRMTEILLEHPTPCIVCHDPSIVGTGTWIPDETRRLAVGSKDAIDRVFAFCLCAVHVEESDENNKAIMQAVTKTMRAGQGFEV
jgi:hypothetical protein